MPQEEAERRAAEQASRLANVVAPQWRAARRWTAAVVLALFPLLFIVDRAVETRLSPVLPGLALLLLLLLGLPFVLMEAAARRHRGRDLAWRARKAARSAQNARSALVAAAVWVGLWFAVGT